MIASPRQEGLSEMLPAEMLRVIKDNADHLDEDSPEQLAALYLDMQTFQYQLMEAVDNLDTEVFKEALRFIQEEW